jgi:tripartite-type tricarboxylate transporter receptor subunit TctC
VSTFGERLERWNILRGAFTGGIFHACGCPAAKDAPMKTAAISRRAFIATTALTLALPALAQEYPNRPIRLIIPYAAGGSVTAIVRTIGERIAKSLGQPVVVENRGGAGGNIGSAEVARAAPDGYTLLLGTISTHAINPSLYRHLAFDALKDFTPVTLLGMLPNVLVVNANAPYHTVSELVAYAKAHPGKLSFASPSVGTTAHLSGEQLKAAAGIDMVHVPYKGGAPALTDLIGGNVQLMFSDIGTARQHIRTGRLRALAVSSAERSPLLPEVPTMAEAGWRDIELAGWNGIFAPARTPAPIVERLNREIVAALNTKEVRDILVEQGLQPQGMSPSEFAAFVRQQNTKLGALVKATGATVD